MGTCMLGVALMAPQSTYTIVFNAPAHRSALLVKSVGATKINGLHQHIKQLQQVNGPLN